MSQNELSESIELQVRFSEVDSMRVVWHGNYLKYFEEGREAFGRKYQIGYFDVENQGLLVPVVRSSVDYKKSLRYGDHFIVETHFINTPAAKIIFRYVIRRKQDGALIAQGETIQVFTDPEGELQLVLPEFFSRWKSRWIK